MSERQPLLPQHVTKQLPSKGKVERTIKDNAPDKESRIQVAQAYGALKAGKLPSQEQISKILDLITKSDALKSGGGSQSRTARLGPEGTQILNDTKSVLAAVKAWGEGKNGDDLLQNIFYEVSSADLEVDANAPTASIPSKKELNKDADKAIQSFKTIAQLLVTSPAFRSLGSDAILLSRDILADGAEVAADNAKQAANATRPSESERSQGVDFKDLKNKGKDAAYHAKTGKTQAEAREKADEKAGSVKQYFDDKLPDADEAKDQLVQRLKEIVTQAQSNKQYHQAINTLIGIVKKYVGKAEDALEEAKDKSEVSDEDEHVQQAGRDLKAFVEKLADKSLDPLIKAAQKAGKDIKDDKKLSAYFEAIESYLDRLLHDEGYVVSQRAYRKASSLYDDGQSLLTENPTWKNDAHILQNEITSFLNALSHDELTANLVDAIEALSDDLASAGKIGLSSLKFDGAGLYRDIIDVIAPRVVGLVKEIPIPRIEYKSEDVDAVIDDFNLTSASFIPQNIRFTAHNDLEFTQGYATYASEYDASVRLRVQGLNVAATDIAYWFNKKTGYFGFEDEGLLDIDFGPKGISFDVTLENAAEEARETFFVVKNVDVDITGFTYTLRQNSKWWATWLAKPALKAFIHTNVQSALEVQITELLKSADFQLYGLQQRAIAATNARPTPANYLKAIFSTSIFGGGATSGLTQAQTGVTKYGRKGEYILHVGVDEDLFPNKPEHLTTKRQEIKAKLEEASEQAKKLTGVTVNKAKDVKKEAAKVAGDAQKEGEDLKNKSKEAERREARQEGWRSDAFDV